MLRPRGLARPSPAVMLRSFGSLRSQLIFWNVVAVSLLLGGLGIVCRLVTLSFMMQSVDQELERSIGMYQRHKPSGPPRMPRGPELNAPPPQGNSAPPYGPGGQPPPDPKDLRRQPYGDPQGQYRPPPMRPMDAANPYHARLFYAVGQTEIPGDNAPALDTKGLERALRGEVRKTTVMIDGEPVRVLSAPGSDHRNRPGAVQVGYALKEVYRAVEGVDMALLVLIPIGLIGAWWLGVALTNRVLKPVQHMSQAAGRIGAEDLSQRLPVSGEDEFSALADTFNGLLGRLDSAFQDQIRLLQLQRRFTADASHELKTPLTIIKGGASLALSRESTDERSCRTFQEIDEAADTMSRLVQDLLLLARSDEGQLGGNTTELLVGEILTSARSQSVCGDSAPIAIDVAPETLTVSGSQVELVRLFRNLLDNAIHYTPPDGQITVTARARQDTVVVTVKDTGLGIAPEHLPHLGERFFRVDASRTRPTGGTGLGLSICRSIAAAHGGSIAFESGVGIGTTVTVNLPQNLKRP